MAESMLWYKTHRADRRAASLSDRHYSRATPGSAQFVMPGRALILITAHADAVWASSWPYAQWVRRAAFKGAWLCSLFRNESRSLSSDLIRQALAATRAHWGDPPADGMITFVDATKVRSRNPGYCFRRAGFQSAGHTANGLLILRIDPRDIPPAEPALGSQLALLP